MAGERVLLPDDCVEYRLFPRISNAKSGKTTAEYLEDCREKYIGHLGSYLVDYIWQHQPFSLCADDGLSDNLPPHVYGRTVFGDNIDDEWCIVFLLFELTKAFPDLVVRIADNDGEFLLIEMAEHLPKWMNPDTTENRVFIYQGSVHVVPVNKNGPLASLSEGIPSLTEAAAAVREYPALTKCDVKCQQALLRRIGCYPDKLKENRHRAHCYLPASVAVMLKHQPSLLSAAVQAFYLRTPSDLKLCRAMKYFPPETRVMTEVVFTRCLYAQLTQQKFTPDKYIGWNLPPPGSPKFVAMDLGVKLSCGFEILVGTCGKTKSSSSLDGPFSEDKWQRFLQSLGEKGYFRGEVVGSKLYQSLYDKAKWFFEDNFSENHRKETSNGQQILDLLQKVEVDMEALQQQEKDLSPPDDDSWLDITPEKLDALLQDKVDGGTVKTVASKLAEFVEHTSSFAGAEVPTLRENPNHSNKAGRVTLDPDTFADAVQSILDFKLPDWEEGSSSDMSDYSDEDLHDGIGNRQERKKVVDAMKNYMSEMDQELAGTAVDREANEEPATVLKDTSNNVQSNAEDLGNLSPVDVDLSSLRNILESYRCQQGQSGPVSNMLGTMGIELHPQNQ